MEVYRYAPQDRPSRTLVLDGDATAPACFRPPKGRARRTPRRLAGLEVVEAVSHETVRIKLERLYPVILH